MYNNTKGKFIFFSTLGEGGKKVRMWPCWWNCCWIINLVLWSQGRKLCKVWGKRCEGNL